VLGRPSADQIECCPAGHILGKKKNQKEETKLWNPEPQSVKSFSMPRYTEKTGGLQHHQMVAPNHPRRCRQQIWILKE
jgi:hypothetical protein